MAFDPNFPANNTPATAVGMRNQLSALKSIIDAGSAPIGCVVAWLKSFPNTPVLPASWAECNGQVLNDAQSPYNGLSVPDLNGAQGGVPMFLRGANASGGAGGSETHSHGLPLNVNGGSVQAGADVTVFPPGNYTSDPASSLPSYYEVVWVMRVK
jgi:hypothetical protein